MEKRIICISLVRLQTAMIFSGQLSGEAEISETGVDGGNRKRKNVSDTGEG